MCIKEDKYESSSNSSSSSIDTQGILKVVYVF